ncbi:CidA/LrgA family protein [Alkalilimnicola ehrlichii MLHE-1]|uniref:LrgA family protein n=1 Tax=Alkalilimnicola ehrlichii (strain ATCC BAA-1101 / DSM 17681 / MLHE-1) TaxID=187272 RepID=Q0ABK8_ALKEH|nr:CidA/LrgA family protein [Alkalilimnicola ehrlichii]ABI55779.1 LrgA family protein [Alkalilimnicola ehrlichii MLHE-1]
MLNGFALLLVFQLVGEFLSRVLHLPIPGPVIGMMLLFAALVIRGGVPKGLRLAGEGLLAYLALLFVPAGVGLMAHLRLIGQDGLAILVALLVSTVLTLAVTGWLLQVLQRRRRHDG